MISLLRAWITLSIFVGCLSNMSADDPPAKPGAAEAYSIPYRLSDVKHVVIRVKINGKGPFNFIVDTGAPAVYIGTEAAKKAGIEVKKDGSWETIESFEIEGGLKLPGLKARVEEPFQLVGINKINAAGIRYHGIVGYSILAQFKVEYDFTKTHLTWTRLNWTPPIPERLGSLSQGATDNMKAMVGVSLLATSFLPRRPDPIYSYRGMIGVELEERQGHVIIKSVLQESPAALKGVSVGDRIVKVNDESIEKSAHIERLIAASPADREVTLVIERAGSEKTIRLTPVRGF